MTSRLPDRRGDDHRAFVVPGTAGEWERVAGHISGLMLALSESELDGHAVPPAVVGGRALCAAGVVLRSVRRRVLPPRRDVADLDAAARALGRELAAGTETATVAVLRAEAAVHGVAPGQLVAELAAVAGMLVDPRGSHELWRAVIEPTWSPGPGGTAGGSDDDRDAPGRPDVGTP